MRRAGRLMERVLERENLRTAFGRASRGKRARSDARRFAEHLEENLLCLADDVRSGEYVPGPPHRFTIHDPKERIITAPAFRDRVLHHAVMGPCEPVFERRLIDDTFACRIGKGRIAAVRRAGQFARRYASFLKVDIRRYFDSIPHDRLLDHLGRLFKDRRLLDLFARIVRSHETAPGRGLPIGSLTSQHFANVYLGPLDRFVKETLRVRGYVRYMDDFVTWDDDRVRLGSIRDQIREFVARELGLALKPEPYINRCVHGMDFLGCRIFPTYRTLSRRSRVRFRREVHRLEREYDEDRIDEPSLQRRVTALVAFARSADVASWRWRSRVVGSSPVGGHGLGPGASRRELEQQRQELPLGEPQQGRARQPQPEQRIPPGRSSAVGADAATD